MSSDKAIKDLKSKKKRIDQIEKILGHIQGWKTINYSIHYAGKRKSISIQLSDGHDPE